MLQVQSLPKEGLELIFLRWRWLINKRSIQGVGIVLRVIYAIIFVLQVMPVVSTVVLPSTGLGLPRRGNLRESNVLGLVVWVLVVTRAPFVSGLFHVVNYGFVHMLPSESRERIEDFLIPQHYRGNLRDHCRGIPYNLDDLPYIQLAVFHGFSTSEATCMGILAATCSPCARRSFIFTRSDSRCQANWCFNSSAVWRQIWAAFWGSLVSSSISWITEVRSSSIATSWVVVSGCSLWVLISWILAEKIYSVWFLTARGSSKVRRASVRLCGVITLVAWDRWART